MTLTEAERNELILEYGCCFELLKRDDPEWVQMLSCAEFVPTHQYSQTIHAHPLELGSMGGARYLLVT